MLEDSTTKRLPDTQPAQDSTTRFLSPAPSETIQRIRKTEQSLHRLIERTKSGVVCEQGFVEVSRLLEALPLPTADFDLANRRLQNALDYARSGEFGAAAFELRMVRGFVQRL
jgi:hypothetical protein